MIEANVVEEMFSFVASVLSTSVRAVVMSQFICIAPSPCPVVPPWLPAKNNYWLIYTALALVLKQERKTSTL